MYDVEEFDDAEEVDDASEKTEPVSEKLLPEDVDEYDESCGDSSADAGCGGRIIDAGRCAIAEASSCG